MENILENFALSKSSAELYLQCGYKFDLKYLKKELGLQKREDQEASLFGNLIHEILEEKFDKNPDGNILEIFDQKFVKSPLLSQKFYDLGKFLLEEYVSDSAPVTKVLGVEIPFQFYLDNGVPVKGFIDRIDELDENTIEIVDYKTGFSQPLTPDALKSDIQVGIYNLAANHLFPQYKNVKLTLNYLHFGKVSCFRDEKNLDNLKGYLKVIYEKIQNSAKTGIDLEPRINSYCGYCEYKSKCPAYKEVVEKHDSDISTFNAMILPDNGITVDLNKLDSFRNFVKGKIKILKSVEDKVDEFIAGYIKTNGTAGRAVIGKTNYQTTSKRYTNYDLELVAKIATEKRINLDQVLSVQKGNVDELFDKESLNLLKEKAKISYGKEFIR